MKTRIYVLAGIIMLTSIAVNAQKQVVDANKSSIEWLGKKIGGQHNGTIKLKFGELELKGDKIVSGSFTIDMTTIANADMEDEGYKQKLVGHLKSDDFFGVDKFPTSSFKVTKSTAFKNGKASLTGDITIKGKTESISFDVIQSGKQYMAKVEIDRSKFDVRYGSNSFFDNLGDKAIDDIFMLDIKLVLN